MAIYRHLEGASFGEADVERLGEAYECALNKLRLVDRKDPVTELVAGKIIEIYRSGEHDPSAVCARALEELGVPESKAPEAR
jgi:hypothetical protein